MKARQALFWVIFWMFISGLFNLAIYIIFGAKSALQFLGGYVIELSLSMDNLFLFLLIFEAYKIPSMYRRRVLNYGIFGAIVLRFIFIMLGVTIVNKFHWVLHIFGAVLIISGLKMLMKEDSAPSFEKSRVVGTVGRIIPITNRIYGESFFVMIGKVKYATPLFAILVLIEASDILFAIDSIPAIFSITTSPFIVYTSNIFAILGLRSLYFVLERLNNSFCYVKYGVGMVLIFTGFKLLILFFNIEIPLIVSLGAIFIILFMSILFSVFFPEKKYGRA